MEGEGRERVQRCRRAGAGPRWWWVFHCLLVGFLGCFQSINLQYAYLRRVVRQSGVVGNTCFWQRRACCVLPLRFVSYPPLLFSLPSFFFLLPSPPLPFFQALSSPRRPPLPSNRLCAHLSPCLRLRSNETANKNRVNHSPSFPFTSFLQLIDPSFNNPASSS
jgi:hypothetical protein